MDQKTKQCGCFLRCFNCCCYCFDIVVVLEDDFGENFKSFSIKQKSFFVFLGGSSEHHCHHQHRDKALAQVQEGPPGGQQRPPGGHQRPPGSQQGPPGGHQGLWGTRQRSNRVNQGPHRRPPVQRGRLHQCGHVIQCHLMSSSVIQYHLVSSSVIQCHLVSPSVIQCHLVSHSIIQCHLVSFSVIQCHLVSSSVIQCHLVSPIIIQCHSVSSTVTQCYLVSSSDI